MRVLDAAQIEAALPIDRAIAAVRAAMIALGRGALVMPPRQVMSLVDGSGVLGVMPVSAADPPIYGVKLFTLHPRTAAKGLPTIQGVIALFDHATGAPIAILDAAPVTALRTAAASALATDLLARADAASHGVFGTGVQARGHVLAVLAVRPGIARTLIWGRDAAKADALAAALAAETGRDVRAAPAEEVAACDIVTTVTAAAAPVLHGAALKDGAHVNLVGSHTPDRREADGAAMARAAIYVDTRDGALSEAGDILLAIGEGAITTDAIVGEIGAVLTGAAPGRRTPDQVTLYKSLGVAAQDLFAAHAVLAAREGDSGAKAG